MNTEQILQIVSYGIAALAVIFSVIQFVYVKVKGKKSKFIDVALDFIGETSSLMGFAEQMQKLSQEERKAFAKDSLLMWCENKNIPITDKNADDLIETLIVLSKTVNAREKDKIEGGNGPDGNNTTAAENVANVESDTQSDELI